jgi:glucokinase
MPESRSSVRQRGRAVIALDLGGTKLASALFGDSEKLVAKRSISLERRAGTAVGELILNDVRRLQKTAAKRGLGISAVGICVPGIAHRRTGRVWAPNIEGWDDYPLRAEIQSALDDPSAKVVVESDRAACIVGETWRGAARGCRNAVFLTVGTGIGTGILIDGRVLRGAHDIAGAIGWLALDRPFDPAYSQCGCFESHASGEGIAAQANALRTRLKSYRGPLQAPTQISTYDVFEAFQVNDPIATKVLAEAVEFWGMATANLVSLFNPEMIVYGGGVFGPAAEFLDAIALEAGRWAQPVAMQRVQLKASRLGTDAALYGAAALALRRARLPLS